MSGIWFRPVSPCSPNNLLLYFSISLLLCGSEAFAETVEEYTQQASQLMRNYQWREAATLLGKGLQRHPDEPALLVGLASILTRLGHAAKGEQLLQRALIREPENPDFLRGAAQAHLHQGKLSTAIALFREALQHGSDDERLHHQLAFSLFLRGDEKGALEQSRLAIQENPIHPSYRRLYALLLDTQDRSEESYRQLRVAYRLAPRDASLLFELSENRRLAGNLAQAVEYLDLAIKLDPENPVYHREISSLYRHIGENEIGTREAEIADSLRRAFQVYLKALKLAVKEAHEEAAHYLAPVVQKHPEFVTGTVLLADLYQKSGQQERALELYLQVLNRDSYQVQAREQSAWIKAQQGSLDFALKLLRESRWESANQVLIEGYREVVRENWEEALDRFRKAERLHPLDPRLLQLIAFCLNAQGKKEEALRYLGKAERIDSGNQEIRRQATEIKLEEARQLVREKRWQRALQAFTKLIREEGAEAEYLFNRGYCLQQLGDLKRAVGDYRAGLRFNPNATWARINLASSLYLAADYQGSAAEWERVLRKDNTPKTYFHLGLSYSQPARIQETEQVLQKAWNLGYQTPELLYNLGIVKLRRKKVDTAWYLIGRSAAAGHEPARLLLQERRNR